MPRPIDRLEQDIQDTLTRLSTLKMSERAIERESGVPQGFLAKLRKGKNRHPNAVESLAKLRRFLVEKGVLAKPGAPEKITKAVVAAAVASSGAPAIVLEPDGARTPLGQAIVKATTFRRLGVLVSTIGAAVADELLDLKTAETLEKLVKGRAAILKQERAESAVAKVRALEILTPDEVKLLADYRAGLAGPPLKAGDYPPPPSEAPTAVALEPEAR